MTREMGGGVINRTAINCFFITDASPLFGQQYVHNCTVTKGGWIGWIAETGFFAWPASGMRRRGIAGVTMSAALASYEEAFRVTAHESHVEIRAQAERRAPVLSPDGHSRRNPAEARPAKTAERLRLRPRRSRQGFGRWVDRLRRGR